MKFQTFLLGLTAAAVPFLSTSCSDDDDPVVPPPPPPSSPETATFDSTVAVAWMNQLRSAVQTAGFPPTVASRVYAYGGVTFYEAVVAGMPDHQSLAGQLNGLSALPVPSDDVHHWPAVANTAVAAVARALFAVNPTAVAAIDALEDQLEADFVADGVEADVLDRSIVQGTDLGTAILAWAAEDGLAQWNNCPYTVPVGPGFWEPTPPAFAAAPHQPCWGKLRTYALGYAAECASLAPAPFSETPGSKFYLEALEVQTTVDAADPEQVAIAQFWADNPTQSSTPSGHWVSILAQCSTAEDYSLDVCAEAMARLGIAVGDAFISCWDMKYYYNLLRPITYIRSATGLNDPTWLTAAGIGGGNIATPAFPEHTSGHSVQSGAVAEVLTDMLGEVAFDDDTHAGLGLPARSFDSFFDAAEEAAISRLYGGIHFRSAIERGVEQGRCVGNVINTQIHFRK